MRLLVCKGATVCSSLSSYNSKVLAINSDIISACNQILQHYSVRQIYSHRETGILVTYERDKSFARYCRNNLISWKETINNGVRRGIHNRESWFEDWNQYMAKDQLVFSPKQDQLLCLDALKTLEESLHPTNLDTPEKSPFQKGGTSNAWKYANSFFEERHKEYMFHISKPENSRVHCSRL